MRATLQKSTGGSLLSDEIGVKARYEFPNKAAFTAPESAYSPESPLWDTYSCPAGSVLFFTEAVSHSGVPWVNPDRDRVALFNAYNDVNSRWSTSKPSQELLDAMPPLRQSLFREAYTKGNVTGQERGAHY